MLTPDEVKHIAILARIGIRDEEVEKYRTELSAVFDFFNELKQVPTEDVEPIRHITGSLDVIREDVVNDFGKNGKEKIMKNVPGTQDNFVKVRSVF